MASSWSASRLRDLVSAIFGPRGTRGLGRAGEACAARHLRRKGYRVLARNVRVPMGEADLVCVAPDGRTVVVVEVKCKRIAGGGRAAPPPEASIHARKRRKLLQIARWLRRANGWEDRPVRIDVVAVDWPERGGPSVRHYERAVATEFY